MQKNKVRQIARKMKKDLKGEVNILSIIEYIKRQGYSTVFYNTPEGDQVLQSYDLPNKPDKAFTYCGTTRIVFINNDCDNLKKIYSLLHELGHILMDNIESDECYILDKRITENRVEAFVYEVITQNNVLCIS